MPFDGAGNFTPSAPPNFPAIAGDPISSTYYNVVINDIATALSNALTRDGQGKPSANIDWNNKNLTNIATLAATIGTIAGSAILTAAMKGIANGVPDLDATGKIPVIQLPDTVLGALQYQGTWNATTNIPVIPTAAAGNEGHYYVVNVAGTTSINGIASWDVGDWIVSNGVVWEKVDNSASVSSVAGLVGAIAGADLKTAMVFVKGDVGLGNVDNTTDASKPVSTATQTALDLKVNLIPNIQTVASASTVTPTFLNDQVNITALAAACQLANPTGTAQDAWGIVVRIKDNGTARALTYGSQYRAVGITLPTTTVLGKTLYLGMIFNNADTKWDVVSKAQEA